MEGKHQHLHFIGSTEIQSRGYISSEQTELVNNALPAFYGSYNSFPWWGEEMKGGVGGEGETQPAEGWRGEQWRSGGGIQNEEALSMGLYCTLSVIATQIRASHRNHLHIDQCTVQRNDAAVITADFCLSGCNKKMETQLLGSCACMITA